MAASPSASRGRGAQPAPTPPTQLTVPSQRPNEPITAGLAQQQPPPGGIDPQDVAKMQAYAPMLELLASSPGSSPQTRMFVRNLLGQLPA